MRKAFASEEACHEYLEAARWPNGVKCLICGHSKVSKFTVKGRVREYADGTVKTTPDRFMYQCLNGACKYQFATTTGTLFSDTKLPLSKWMLGIALMVNAKKGLSAKQMERDLDVSYKTAWFLSHRIRKAMEEGVNMFSGTVELDETYVGGRYDRRRKRARYDKAPVFGMIERETGKVVAGHVPAANNYFIHGEIEKQVSKTAHVMSDESRLYKSLTRKGWKHEIVVHSNKEWVRGDVHTQGIDGFWGLLKRAVIESFHQVSVKHLDRYIAECQFKWNNREDRQVFSAVIVGLMINEALRYKRLTGPTDAEIAAVPLEPSDPSEEMPF